jgi:hypothetical protein
LIPDLPANCIPLAIIPISSATTQITTSIIIPYSFPVFTNSYSSPSVSATTIKIPLTRYNSTTLLSNKSADSSLFADAQNLIYGVPAQTYTNTSGVFEPPSPLLYLPASTDYLTLLTGYSGNIWVTTTNRTNLAYGVTPSDDGISGNSGWSTGGSLANVTSGDLSGAGYEGDFDGSGGGNTFYPLLTIDLGASYSPYTLAFMLFAYKSSSSDGACTVKIRTSPDNSTWTNRGTTLSAVGTTHVYSCQCVTGLTFRYIQVEVLGSSGSFSTSGGGGAIQIMAWN